jgi:hypothetical protein
VTIEAKRMQSGDRLATRACRRMAQDATLATVFGAANLRNDLDQIPLWRDGKVEVRTLMEDYAQFVYLQRLKSPEILQRTIAEGVSRITWQQDGFAFAEGFDVAKQCFTGLVAGQMVDVGTEGRGWLVTPELARRQLDTEVGGAAGTLGSGGSCEGQQPPKHPQPGTAATERKTVFYGRVRPNVAKLATSVGAVANEVVAHLQLLDDAEVEVTVEIRAKVPGGIDEKTKRTILENSKFLKFDVSELS